MSKLNPIERWVVHERAGGRSYEEMALDSWLSPDRIRQVEELAVDRLFGSGVGGIGVELIRQREAAPEMLKALESAPFILPSWEPTELEVRYLKWYWECMRPALAIARGEA